MAVSMGMMGSMGASSGSASPASSVGSCGARSRVLKGRRRSGGDVICAAAGGSLMKQYRTLRVQPGASEKEVKRAFRQLALQYHPDVCHGSNCSVQFHQINEAYDIVMSSLRLRTEEQEWSDGGGDAANDSTGEMCDPSWDLWEEWMGWEGAGIRDYSSHINPYI